MQCHMAFTWPVTLYFPLVHNISKCSTESLPESLHGEYECHSLPREGARCFGTHPRARTNSFSYGCLYTAKLLVSPLVLTIAVVASLEISPRYQLQRGTQVYGGACMQTYLYSGAYMFKPSKFMNVMPN